MTLIHRHFQVSDTPQIVMVTMEGAINDEYIALYNKLFNGSNPNGCAIKGTFFVTDANTDMSLVKGLMTSGHEIGINSVDGTIPTSGTDWINVIKRKRNFSLHQPYVISSGARARRHA